MKELNESQRKFIGYITSQDFLNDCDEEPHPSVIKFINDYKPSKDGNEIDDHIFSLIADRYTLGEINTKGMGSETKRDITLHLIGNKGIERNNLNRNMSDLNQSAETAETRNERTREQIKSFETSKKNIEQENETRMEKSNEILDNTENLTDMQKHALTLGLPPDIGETITNANPIQLMKGVIEEHEIGGVNFKFKYRKTSAGPIFTWSFDDTLTGDFDVDSMDQEETADYSSDMLKRKMCAIIDGYVNGTNRTHSITKKQKGMNNTLARGINQANYVQGDIDHLSYVNRTRLSPHLAAERESRQQILRQRAGTLLHMTKNNQFTRQVDEIQV